jgi:hypothetical protein
MPDNDISDFLLKEYENIAQAFFNAREVLAKWVKYYLLVMAVPFSFIAFIYKDQPKNFNIFELPETLSILISLIGLIGLFLSFIIIDSGIDSILYARTVNGIRKFFLDREPTLTIHDNQFINTRDYTVLPDSKKKPAYLSCGELAWITIVTSLIDSFYLSMGFPQISFLKDIYKEYICQNKLIPIIFFISLIIHVFYYVIASMRKENKYGTT